MINQIQFCTANISSAFKSYHFLKKFAAFTDKILRLFTRGREPGKATLISKLGLIDV